MRQTHSGTMRRYVLIWLVLVYGLVPGHSTADDLPPPVLLGFDGSFSMVGGTAAPAIERGIRVAMAEINATGGVLGGRLFQLVTADNRANPARGVANVKAFAAMPNLVAVFGGSSSPVVLETVKIVHDLKIPLLAPWSSAQGIVDNGHTPNYVFRLSLYDNMAMPAMLQEAQRLGHKRIGLMLQNTVWGRSNLAAAERYLTPASDLKIIGVVQPNVDEPSMLPPYLKLLEAGADVIILAARDLDGALLVREMTALEAELRRPIISHWGLASGDAIAKMKGPTLERMDIRVIQTFSLFRTPPQKLQRIMQVTQALFNLGSPEQIESQVGFGHAYDLTHILARAIALAETTEHSQVRDALERVHDYDGLIRYFAQPFTPDMHEALRPSDIFFARFRADGVLIPLER